MTGILYTVGMSFAIIGRTRLNILVGMKRQETAKNFFVFFYYCCLIVGVCLGLLTLVFRDPIADFYSSSSAEMRAMFLKLVTIYSFCMFSEVSIYYSMIGLKTAGRINDTLIFNFIWAVLYNSILISLLYYTTASIPLIFTGLMSSFISLNLSCALKTVLVEWHPSPEQRIDNEYSQRRMSIGEESMKG